MELIFYAFADKFLEGKDLEKVKEEVSMTKIGEMLVEDGIKKGKELQAVHIAIKAIEMGLENDAISKLTGLIDKEINILRRARGN